MMGPFANRVLPFSVGLAGGAVGMYMYLAMPETIAHHPAIKYGQPESSKVRWYRNFVTEVDFSTRNPKWVLEHLDEAQTASKAANRKGARYHEDEEIDPRFRASLSHYRQSGYDRGHMSPAMNNKNSDQAMSESFVLSNVAPQVGKGFNRDYWARFERFINDTVVPACKDVYVVTGPLYLESTSENLRTGASLVPFEQRGSDTTAIAVQTTETSVGMVKVPSHFYKVILGELKQQKPDGSDVVVGAFVLPNAQIHPKTPLSSFQVPLGQLELVAGIDFFPKLDTVTGRGAPRRGDVCGLNACQLPPEQFWLPANERTTSESADGSVVSR